MSSPFCLPCMETLVALIVGSLSLLDLPVWHAAVADPAPVLLSAPLKGEKTTPELISHCCCQMDTCGGISIPLDSAMLSVVYDVALASRRGDAAAPRVSPSVLPGSQTNGSEISGGAKGRD
ncbi:hypothetical protein B0I35DRAFT_437522 [Stachybotrys elegans]|uniref:Secreted protein n=1 Tax=Stachybotrys elegans TaxID=80388 RepID=A0A8K0SKE4_9HYPO|nr:hypothetical protein B0I35DRAFT_437522 [Stachybotrys elegans]